MAEQITTENYGPWNIHGGSEHCGVRIDGPNGRAVLHVIQRDPHPALGQGITQAESEAIARRIVDLWNETLTHGAPVVAAWLRNDGMKAMPADEKEAWFEAGQPEIAEDYTIPLYRAPAVDASPGAKE